MEARAAQTVSASVSGQFLATARESQNRQRSCENQKLQRRRATRLLGRHEHGEHAEHDKKNLNQARSAATSVPAKTHTALLKAKSKKLLLPGFGILCWLAPESASWSQRRSKATFQIRARLVPLLRQFDLHQPALLPGQFPQLLPTQKPKAKQQPVLQPVPLLLLPAPRPCLNSLQLLLPPTHQAAPLPPKPDHVLLVL